MYSSYWFCSPHKPQYRDQMSNVRIEVFSPPGVAQCEVVSSSIQRLVRLHSDSGDFILSCTLPRHQSQICPLPSFAFLLSTNI